MKLAGLDLAVDKHVTVRVTPTVIHPLDAASVPQEGWGRDVKKVDSTRNTDQTF